MNQLGDNEVRDQVETRRQEDGRQAAEESEQSRGDTGIAPGTDDVSQYFTGDVEDVSTERVGAVKGDSGQIETLPDGSISIPVLEEELVVSKRLVVRERIIIRKQIRTEHHRVEANLRRERVQVDVDNPDEERRSSEK